MITVNIRKQGGAAIMTIPAHVLKTLNIDVGSILEIDMTDKGFFACPAQQHKRKRYTLDELLTGATPETIQALNQSTEWARQGGPMGNEIA